MSRRRSYRRYLLSIAVGLRNDARLSLPCAQMIPSPVVIAADGQLLSPALTPEGALASGFRVKGRGGLPSA
jgi:hypothetical protein